MATTTKVWWFDIRSDQEGEVDFIDLAPGFYLVNDACFWHGPHATQESLKDFWDWSGKYSGERVVFVGTVVPKLDAVASHNARLAMSDREIEEAIASRRYRLPGLPAEAWMVAVKQLEELEREQRDRRRVKSMQDFLAEKNGPVKTFAEVEAEQYQGPAKHFAQQNPSLDGGWSPVLPDWTSSGISLTDEP